MTKQGLLQDLRTSRDEVVRIVRTLSDRLRRANKMLSSVDMLADWLAGSMV